MDNTLYFGIVYLVHFVIMMRMIVWILRISWIPWRGKREQQQVLLLLLMVVAVVGVIRRWIRYSYLVVERSVGGCVWGYIVGMLMQMETKDKVLYFWKNICIKMKWNMLLNIMVLHG